MTEMTIAMTIERVKEILKDYIEEGNLSWKIGRNCEFVGFIHGNKHATLDGSFTADELMAISLWMKING